MGLDTDTLPFNNWAVHKPALLPPPALQRSSEWKQQRSCVFSPLQAGFDAYSDGRKGKQTYSNNLQVLKKSGRVSWPSEEKWPIMEWISTGESKAALTRWATFAFDSPEGWPSGLLSYGISWAQVCFLLKMVKTRVRLPLTWRVNDHVRALFYPPGQSILLRHMHKSQAHFKYCIGV